MPLQPTDVSLAADMQHPEPLFASGAHNLLPKMRNQVFATTVAALL